jgi:CheY-like chemotaxis protein
MSMMGLWDALTGHWNAAVSVPETGGMSAQGWGAVCAVGNTGDMLPGVTVLAVDDEPRMLEVIAEALGELGLRVVTCRDAGEGLGAFALLGGPAVLVTDIGLHGVPGVVLAEAFRDTRPDGAVVFTSGLRSGSPTAMTLGARDIVLRKPFNRRDLRAAVCRAAALASNGPWPAPDRGGSA